MIEPSLVIPAQAGIQQEKKDWVPAFAGMSKDLV